MLSYTLRRYFYPHELIAIPFLGLVIGIYVYFGLDFKFFSEIAFWLLLTSLFLFFSYLLLNFFRVSFFYLFNKELRFLKVNRKKLIIFLRTLLSLIIIILIYQNLEAAITYLAPIDQDASLLYYDQLFFGQIHITVWLQKFINAGLTDWLNFAYLTFFFYLPTLGVFLYIKGKSSEWSLLVLVISMTFFSGYILYAFFPAVGPAVYMANDYYKSLDGSLVTSTAQTFVSTQGFPRGTFPSLHIACSTVYLFFAYKTSKLLFLVLLPVIVCLWVSTIYLRHHYLIDIFAGYCLAIVCIYFGSLIWEKWNVEIYQVE